MTQRVITAREPFYRAGADFSFNYRTFNLFGQYLYGRDRNLIPFIPESSTLPVGFIGIHPVKYSGGFLQADYLVLPWMMAIMRWDNVNSHWDYLNGIGADASAPPPSPFLSPSSAAAGPPAIGLAPGDGRITIRGCESVQAGGSRHARRVGDRGNGGGRRPALRPAAPPADGSRLPRRA